MKYLKFTRARIPEIRTVNSRQDLEEIDAGDLVKVHYLGDIQTKWMVYAGEKDDKPVFLRQSADNPQDIISYTGDKESAFFQKGHVVLVHGREMKTHKIGDIDGHCYKMELLMAAGLWKSPARMVPIRALEQEAEAA